MSGTPVVLSITGRQTYGNQPPETIELVTEGTMTYRDGAGTSPMRRANSRVWRGSPPFFG